MGVGALGAGAAAFASGAAVLSSTADATTASDSSAETSAMVDPSLTMAVRIWPREPPRQADRDRITLATRASVRLLRGTRLRLEPAAQAAHPAIERAVDVRPRVQRRRAAILSPAVHALREHGAALRVANLALDVGLLEEAAHLRMELGRVLLAGIDIAARREHVQDRVRDPGVGDSESDAHDAGRGRVDELIVGAEPVAERLLEVRHQAEEVLLRHRTERVLA